MNYSKDQFQKFLQGHLLVIINEKVKQVRLHSNIESYFGNTFLRIYIEYHEPNLIISDYEDSYYAYTLKNEKDRWIKKEHPPINGIRYAAEYMNFILIYTKYVEDCKNLLWTFNYFLDDVEVIDELKEYEYQENNYRLFYKPFIEKEDSYGLIPHHSFNVLPIRVVSSMFMMREKKEAMKKMFPVRD